MAEAIVAAQDAGLVETSIDPPPILDILITGRATDLRTLKNTTAKKPYAVSPEVFGAWFTGYGKLEGINYAEDVRIINPSAGLKQWYDTRARILEQYIQEIRKAKGPAPKKEEAKPAETKKAEEPKKTDDSHEARGAQEGLRRAAAIDCKGHPDRPVRRSIRAPVLPFAICHARVRRSRTANVPPWFRARAIGLRLPDSRSNPVVVWSRSRTLRSRPHAVTPSVVSKTTAPLPFLSLACEAARRLGAVGVLILAEGPMEWDVVRVLASKEVAILVASSSQRQLETIRKAGLVAIEVEPTEVAISERISLALIEAVANDILQAGARVVVVYSGFEAEALDSLSVIRLGEHLERLTARDLRALETSVPFETLKAVVDVAIEIGREGREGKAVGTLIVVGDARNVMTRTRQLGFDPFKGYLRKERNVRDFRVREAIKEIAQLDGAFVVARDGTVEAACRLIDAPMSGLTLPKGLGTRHWAAAAITEVTKSVAVVVSQSNGTVRLFQNGDVILRIAPMRHARAMKWQDADTEPAPS